MFAPGAMVCAYSTSRVVSPPQPVMSESLEFQLGIFPSGVMIVNDGGAGSLNCWSKTARSCLIVGEPNESTITIVSPLPVTPRAYSGPRSYAVSTCCGVRQWKEKASPQCACEGVATTPVGWITPGVATIVGAAADFAAVAGVAEHPATVITPAAKRGARRQRRDLASAHVSLQVGPRPIPSAGATASVRERYLGGVRPANS